MILNYLRRLFGSSDDEAELDKRACNISGHDYDGQWSDGMYYTKPEMLRPNRLIVYKRQSARCAKCGKEKSRRVNIGVIEITGEAEIKVV